MRAAAGLGALAAVLGYVVQEHYLQIGWVIAIPVPVVWWVLGWAGGVIGVPLMMAALGRRAQRLVALPWTRLLLTWVVPVLVAYAIWVLVTLLILDRLNPGFAFLTPHRYAELLPEPELSLLYALALLPLLAKLLARVPAPLVILALSVLALVVPGALFLVFGYAGLTLPQAIDRLSERVTAREMVLRAAVAAVGAAVSAIPHLPHGVGTLVAGICTLPFALGLATLLRFPLIEAAGDAAVPIYLLLVPVLAVADKALLARISVRGPSAQALAAIVEPALLTAGITVAGLVLYAAGRRLRRSLRPSQPSQPSRSVEEVTS
jgi:hypothetical protein